MDVYPFPTTQDLFAQLAGRKIFMKLDLSCAYEQLEVAPEFEEMLTSNTHTGLYNVNRMMYGIASAPVIFQK